MSMRIYFTGIWLVLTWLSFPAMAQSVPAAAPSPTPTTMASPAPKKAWYDRIALRGYAQVRYNRLLETNPKLKCEQCDRSIGENGGFLIRRARLILSGDVHERVYIYIQPDFASSASSDGLHFAQLRDLYFDLALTSEKEFRLRFGQSKIPYGWENLQSSSNRLALDRNDALNSGVANERDLGVIFYWAPASIRKLFQEVTNSTTKGSGDYGVFGLGVYNGQTANRPELNDNRHVVARLTYPFQFAGEQIIEPSIQAYTGLFTIPSTQRTQGVKGGNTFRDQRVAASLIYYPRPIGFQIEGNVGRGPEYNPLTNAIETQDLRGGYAQVMFRVPGLGDQSLIPFVRGQYYDGGKKQETDARSYHVREYEIGTEWQPIPAFELTAMYTISHRRTMDGANRGDQAGNLLRLQAQFNY